ncbi:MAG: hypothetical protein ACKVQS_03665 [Fimbriimonadaceae bacterium]
MKKIAIGIGVTLLMLVAVGCGEPEPEAYNATEKIKSMPAEEQYKLIKDNPGLSYPMKERAINALPTTDEQKQKWLEEVKGNTQPGR